MNLDQLRRQAKELRDAARRRDPAALHRINAAAPGLGEPIALAHAQLVIARENGFASWPKLKAATANDAATLNRFLDVSLNGPARTAMTMLRDHPVLGTNPYAAAAIGDADRAVTAVASVDTRGWSPLLYACYSRWHTYDAGRTEALTATVTRLLDAGANPNSHNGRLPNQGYQSALHGAVETNKPDAVALLLARGALTDDRSSLPAAAEGRHHECLELLLEHGAAVERTWALGAAVFARDPWAVRRLLTAIVDGGGDAAAQASEQLEDAARDGATEVIETLLEFGADPNGRGELVKEAVRAGAVEAAALLESRAGTAEVTGLDRLIGACMRQDRTEARRLSADINISAATLDEDDLSVLAHAASRASAATVELLLDAGWPVDARDDLGQTAMHEAAFHGKVDTVRLLLARGGDVDARDNRFDSTPLAFATVGSREPPDDTDGDWAATARTLLDAGASRHGVWLSDDKAPSDDITAVLRSYGVQPEPASSATPAPTDPDDGLAEVGDERLAELAALLRIAFDTSDLDLFGSLLAPNVRWGGGPLGCSGPAQVIAQYRQAVDLGFHGTIAAIESVGDDTLIIELRYEGNAEGLPNGPVGTRAQVLRIGDDLITSIEGYPDLFRARQAAAGG